VAFAACWPASGQQEQAAVAVTVSVAHIQEVAVACFLCCWRLCVVGPLQLGCCNLFGGLSWGSCIIEGHLANAPLTGALCRPGWCWPSRAWWAKQESVRWPSPLEVAVCHKATAMTRILVCGRHQLQPCRHTAPHQRRHTMPLSNCECCSFICALCLSTADICAACTINATPSCWHQALQRL
jgi:hypothetical protein